MQYDAADKEMDQKDNLLIAEYILEGTVLQNVGKSKQLGVPVTEDLRWIPIKQTIHNPWFY